MGGGSKGRTGKRPLYSVRMRATGSGGMHISGAEGIFQKGSVDEAVSAYTKRARSHPRGAAEKVTITVEELRTPPERLRSLDLSTIICASPKEAAAHIRTLLAEAGISGRAIAAAFRVVKSRRTMRGAALIRSTDGRRLEPDRAKGVRATLLGITPRTRSTLERKLKARSIASTETVIEALTLATKVASAPGFKAELCVSDDPGYTTGYISIKGRGYMRLTEIKLPGELHGGRVLFVEPDADPALTISWLQETPVLVTSAGVVLGPASNEN